MSAAEAGEEPNEEANAIATKSTPSGETRRLLGAVGCLSALVGTLVLPAVPIAKDIADVFSPWTFGSTGWEGVLTAVLAEGAIVCFVTRRHQPLAFWLGMIGCAVVLGPISRLTVGSSNAAGLRSIGLGLWFTLGGMIFVAWAGDSGVYRPRPPLVRLPLAAKLIAVVAVAAIVLGAVAPANVVSGWGAGRVLRNTATVAVIVAVLLAGVLYFARWVAVGALVGWGVIVVARWAMWSVELEHAEYRGLASVSYGPGLPLLFLGGALLIAISEPRVIRILSGKSNVFHRR